MIVDFTVKNFRSIKDEQVISFNSNIKDKSKLDNLVATHSKKINLLKTNIIYGPNASGKSNFLLALLYLRDYILNSTDLKLTQKIFYYEPFCLDETCCLMPSEFELEFIINSDQRFIYSISFNTDIVLNEKLLLFKNNKTSLVFERIKNEIKFGNSYKGPKKILSSQLLPSHLFLTKGANSNVEILKNVYLYFLNQIYVEINNNPFIKKNHFGEFIHTTTNRMIKSKDETFKLKLAEFLKTADNNILSIELKQNESNDSIKSFIPVTLKQVYQRGDKSKIVKFDLKFESAGTVKMYEIAGLIISVLENGGVLAFDELDSSLHPLLTESIINLFNNENTNKKNAQLIFSTHDTSLLNNNNFRCDQIWFTEKDTFGSTQIYSLAEFDKNELKKIQSLQNWYLKGRFGALPILNNSLFEPKEI